MAEFRDFAKENSDGWSLVTVQSTLDPVVEYLRKAVVCEYAPDVPVRLMANSKDEDGNVISFTPLPTERTLFAVSVIKSKWCIIFRTLYWCEPSDHDWVVNAAAGLSKSLDCEAIASCSGGHGFSTLIYKQGNLESELPAYDHKTIGKEFTSRKIRLPICFIGGSPPSLFAQQDSLEEIERADQFVCHGG